MRAAVLREYGSPLTIEDLAIAEPRAGEVLVRLAASGICRSDWHTVRGVHPTRLPVVLGHEGAGVVDRVGPGVHELRPGDHVVLTWLPFCGECRWCTAGRPNLCERQDNYDRGLLADGSTRLSRAGAPVFHNGPSSFAELSVVPAQCAIPVPTDLPLAPLALIGCAVLTGFGAVHNTARVPVGSAVVVVGCGGVGLSIVQAARLAGAHRIVAVDRLAGKLKTALRLGATAAVVVDERVESAVRAELPVGADYVFEAVGSAGAFELADRLAGRGGTVVLVGMPPEDARFPIDPLRMVYDERVVKGSWYGSCVPPRDVPRLVELYRAGELRLDELITARCSLDDINQVFRDWEVGAEARSVVTFGDPAGDRIGESR